MNKNEKVETIGCLINGEIHKNNQWIEIKSPDDWKVFGKVPSLSKKDIDFAFESAQSAYQKWSIISLYERIDFLKKWKKIIIENKEKIIELLIKEISKPFSEAEKEFTRTIEYFDSCFEAVKYLYPKAYTGETAKIKNKLAVYTRVAKGTILIITPFNYPFNTALSKIIPALITGNVVIFKPSTQGSFISCFFCKLAKISGLPKGILNIVTGYGEKISEILIKERNIQVIAFTGSTETGNKLANLNSKAELIFEMGGKDFALICNDIKENQFKEIAEKITNGAFTYSGQRCTAIKRVLINNDKYQTFLDIFKEEVKKLKVGLAKENNQITPLINLKNCLYLDELVNDALEKGAQLILNKKRKENLFFPMIIFNVNENMEISKKEQFGPVLPISFVKSEAEAIKIINESNYGLQAAVFTNEINKAFRISSQLNVGTVNINQVSQKGPDYLPFIGIKDSGIGVQGINELLKSFTRLKGLIINY
jgi:glyceraldehyde-3-phosphate dehydrogenase (NADP+)